MKLKYYSSDVPNFGDDLNKVLWSSFAPELFDESEVEAFVGIGTIIGFPCSPQTRLNIFSSGAGNDPLDNWSGLEVTFWCVRGPISAHVIGLSKDDVICDGAVLVPLANCFPKARSLDGGVLVIPHWQSLNHPGWDLVARLSGFELLDPRGSPEAVIGRISGAKCVLTESLHGAILADTYGIPWAAFASTGNFQISKWVDWSLTCGHNLMLTIVPPPDAQAIVKYGRPAAPFGTRMFITEEMAMQEMLARTTKGKPPRLRDQAKLWIKETGVLNRFLYLSAERTAQSLIELSSHVVEPSSETIIATLQERMVDRLDRLRRFVR